MSRRHYRKAPPEMLSQLEAVARSGLPIAEQAKRLGVSVDRMYNLRSEHGLARATPRPSDEEDDATLAAIDQGIKDADEGRTVPLEEVRKMAMRRMSR